MRSHSFDLVTMAYVLHGLPSPLRCAALGQAARISVQGVLVLDHAGPGPWHVRAIELLEGPQFLSLFARPAGALLEAAGLTLESSGTTSVTGGYWLARPAAAAGAP